MRGNETRYYKIAEACEIFGVKEGILRRWDKEGHIKTIRTPGGMRLFDISSIDQTTLSKKIKKEEPVVILYSRVSSRKQNDDLVRQQEYLRNNIPDKYSRATVDEISDIGSGINFKRPGLLQILGRVKEGEISTIIVASRDRLARFGVELIEWMCAQYATKILVLDSEDSTPESELGKDLMAIVQVYCCRWNGRRRYSKNKDKSTEVETSSNNGTETSSESVGRLCSFSLQQDDIASYQSEKQDIEEFLSPQGQIGNGKKPNNKKGKQFSKGKTLVETMS
jgi:predicted site-specific integrase-resolvase